MLLRLAMLLALLLALFAGAHSFGHMTHEEHDEVFDYATATCIGDNVQKMKDDSQGLLNFETCYEAIENGLKTQGIHDACTNPNALPNNGLPAPPSWFQYVCCTTCSLHFYDEEDVAPTCVDSVDDLGNELGFCADWNDGTSYCSADLLNSAGGMEDSTGVYTPEEMNYIREKCPNACQVEGCV